MNHQTLFAYIFLYTDPGTGAMLWQLAAASLIGLAFYFRHFTAKIKVLLTRINNRKRPLA